MRVVEVTADQRERYNAVVSASPHADVLQAYEWGEVKRRNGWDALRLLVEDDTGTARLACSILRTQPARGVPPLLYAPRGPVLDHGDPEALRALLQGIRSRASNAFMFKCDPPVESGSAADQLLRRTDLRPVRSGAFGGVQPTAVMVLELDAGPEKIFEGFKSKWRYNVRLAERKGVEVREADHADLRQFYELLLDTAHRDGFFIRDRSYFETLWELLEPAGMLKMFIGEFGGTPIAGVLLMCMGERVVYTYGASSSEHRNVMPNHLIQWHAIRWATEKGYRIYDFRGVSPVRGGKPVEPHIAGLNRFKEGFGARYVEYAGEFDLPLRTGWYSLWRYGAPSAIALRKKLSHRPEVAE